MQYKFTIVYSNHLAGNCQSSEHVKTQLSSTKEVGLDGDTVLLDYASKIMILKPLAITILLLKVKSPLVQRSRKFWSLSWKWAQKARVPMWTCGRAAKSYWIPASTCGRVARNYPIWIVNASYLNSVKLFPVLSLD